MAYPGVSKLKMETLKFPLFSVYERLLRGSIGVLLRERGNSRPKLLKRNSFRRLNQNLHAGDKLSKMPIGVAPAARLFRGCVPCIAPDPQCREPRGCGGSLTCGLTCHVNRNAQHSFDIVWRDPLPAKHLPQ